MHSLAPYYHLLVVLRLPLPEASHDHIVARRLPHVCGVAGTTFALLPAIDLAPSRCFPCQLERFRVRQVGVVGVGGLVGLRERGGFVEALGRKVVGFDRFFRDLDVGFSLLALKEGSLGLLCFLNVFESVTG